MGYKFNPFTGKFDTVDSPNGVFEEIEVNTSRSTTAAPIRQHYRP
jgi:hypothetical protein